MIDRIVSLMVVGIIITTGFLIWIWRTHPYYILSWWDRHIKPECDRQDRSTLNGIPSYQNAWDASNPSVVQLHRLIFIHQDEIMDEIMNMKLDPACKLSDRLDAFHASDEGWNPIWIRYMGTWAPTAHVSPTLRRIVSLFPDIPSMYISIFEPGHTMIENKGISRATQRYHYGLKIPTEDIGFNLGGYDIKWKQGEGFVWDNTIPHSAWNHTSDRRIVIFADILRNLTSVNSVGSRLMYSIIRHR